VDDQRAGAPTAGPFLVLGAVGVVFGDIGTSTLYAMSAVLQADTSGGETVARPLVYGMVSTIIWSMTLVVTVLYVRLLLRADNDGEGGLLALIGLLRQRLPAGRLLAAASVLGVFGAAMFLGDSVITPAISVLSAAEGLELLDSSLSRFVVPFAFVVLVGLFLIQRFGTGRIGRLFGPIMLLWFASTALWGLLAVAKAPAVLQALSPHWVVLYVRDQPLVAFLSLGAVVLTVTGSEALYADLGHFGRDAIARAWLLVVFPALVLSYLGQAATVAGSSTAVGNPFFAIVPHWARLPMVVLATLATIIASQAVISGAFSVVHQASRLGFLPQLKTSHTSRHHARQIYVPAVNGLLAVAVLAVVLVFRSSASLASAYGIAVTSTITATTVLFLVYRWRRDEGASPGFVVGLALLVVELVFLAANLPKVRSGGWLPLGVGVVLVLVMTSWQAGLRRIDRARAEAETPVGELVERVRDADSGITRVDGTAVYLTRVPGVVPIALDAMLDLNHILHSTTVLLSWESVDVPTVRHDERVRVDVLDDPTDGIVHVHATFGYRQRPDLLAVLRQAVPLAEGELDDLDLDRATFFTSIPVVKLSPRSGMPRWRQRIFLTLERLGPDPVDVLRLPRERTIVVGRELTW
jgi:KUP system potassium uptake protein